MLTGTKSKIKFLKLFVYLVLWKDLCHIPKVQIDTTFEQKIVNIFLPMSFNICFGCSKELSYSDGSFEYPQHIFWFINKKVIK